MVGHTHRNATIKHASISTFCSVWKHNPKFLSSVLPTFYSYDGSERKYYLYSVCTGVNTLVSNENAVGGGYRPCVLNGSSPPHLHQELTNLLPGCQDITGTVCPKQLQVFLIPQNHILDTYLKLIYKLTSLWVLLRTVKKNKTHRHSLTIP